MKKVLIFFVSILILFGCNQQGVLPSISTTNVKNVSVSEATINSFIEENGAEVSFRGVCYSATNNKPTIDDSHTIDGSGTGSFSSYISGLASNTSYYARTYATNSAGTVYGETVVFTTLEENFEDNYVSRLIIPNGWVLESAISDPAFQMPNGSFVLDLITDGYLYAWELDDILVFTQSGAQIIKPGSILPPDGEEEGYSTETVVGNWCFDNIELPSKLYMHIPFFYDDSVEECRILNLSEDQLRISFTVNREYTSSVHVFTLTYVPSKN